MFYDHQNQTMINQFVLEFRQNCDPFPSKLYEMLGMLEKSGLSEAATWLPHGRAFAIIDKNKFLDIVGVCFNQTKFRSFTRQLNIWGFKRVQKGRDSGAWYHKHFMRGNPTELKRINRIKIKTRSSDETTNDLDETEYYKLCPLPVPLSTETYLFGKTDGIPCRMMPPRQVSESSLSIDPSDLNEDSAVPFASDGLSEDVEKIGHNTLFLPTSSASKILFSQLQKFSNAVARVGYPDHINQSLVDPIEIDPLPFEEDIAPYPIERDQFVQFVDSLITNL